MSVKASQLGNIKMKRLARDRHYAARNRELAAMILRARGDGATWPALAKAMGMSRQGLEKFLRNAPRAPDSRSSARAKGMGVN